MLDVINYYVIMKPLTPTKYFSSKLVSLKYMGTLSNED